MNKILSLIITLTLILSQEIHTLKVIIRSENIEISGLEKELIQLVVGLYNNKTSDRNYKIKFIIDDNFQHSLDVLTKAKSNNLICTIKGVTIRESAKFIFSQGYFPINDVIITKRSNTNINWRRKGVKISSYVKSTYLDSMSRIYGFTIVKAKKNIELDNMLLASEMDFYLGDSAEAYFNKEFIIVESIDNTVRYLGIVYNNGSRLKSDLDPYIKHILKSKAYYSLLKKYFGKSISSSYRNKIRMQLLEK